MKVLMPVKHRDLRVLLKRKYFYYGKLHTKEPQEMTSPVSLVPTVILSQNLLGTQVNFIFSPLFSPTRPLAP